MLKKFAAFCVSVTCIVSAAFTAQAAQFSDVSEQHSLHIEIENLAAHNIITGYSDGTFKPNAPIAKKHIAKMLVEALDIRLDEQPAITLPYKDVPRTHPYYNYIAAAYAQGLFGQAEYFKPESSISRAFMAKLLATSFNLKSIAENTVTYKDVPTTSEFYRPIQLVTMNNVARGYAHENGTATFEPNKQLTRAHFSAFLARAMSLTAGDYTPDTRYTYVYHYLADNRRLYLEFLRSGSNAFESYWQLRDREINEHYGETVIRIGDGYWVEGVPNTDVGTFVSYPFTIGLKYERLGVDNFLERQEIVETKATYALGDMVFNDVVVVRERFMSYEEQVKGHYEPSGYKTSTTYISKHYGVVGYKVENDMVYYVKERITR